MYSLVISDVRKNKADYKLTTVDLYKTRQMGISRFAPPKIFFIGNVCILVKCPEWVPWQQVMVFTLNFLQFQEGMEKIK